MALKKVLIFLSQGFEEIEAAAFIDVFGWTRTTEGVEPVEVVVAGLHPEIRAAHSLVVKPQHLLEELNLAEFSALALPGGYHDRGFTEVYSQRVLEAIRTIYHNGGIIATVCVGAKPVAAAGLLRGKEATTYPFDEGRHTSFLVEHGAKVVKRDVIVSDRIITSTGPATAFTVAFKLLEMLNGKDDVERVKKAMTF
jgi:4-methyl-5(b-hydroxyethyl)-thiazole monophosphate biosynthesis